MGSLSDSLHQRITILCEQGDDLVNANDNAGGLQKYHEAWQLLPEPKEDWDAATWVLSAIGDAHFYSNDFTHAISALSNALECPDGLGNSFIHLRLGECYFELGELHKAQDELARAYMGAGRELFENEDPKYFAFLQSVLKPSPHQDSI